VTSSHKEQLAKLKQKNCAILMSLKSLPPEIYDLITLYLDKHSTYAFMRSCKVGGVATSCHLLTSKYCTVALFTLNLQLLLPDGLTKSDISVTNPQKLSFILRCAAPHVNTLNFFKSRTPIARSYVTELAQFKNLLHLNLNFAGDEAAFIALEELLSSNAGATTRAVFANLKSLGLQSINSSSITVRFTLMRYLSLFRL